MKKLLKEFKTFAMRGNVMDMAVGVIIGGAFKGIIDSLVQDIISPLIGLFAKKDFSFLVLRIFGVEVKYGAFLTAVINFLMMAFVIFLLLKGINKLSSLGKKEEEVLEAPKVKACPFCCSEIAIEATRCPHCTSCLEEEKHATTLNM